MRTFSHFNNSHDSICPICKTNADKETTLVAIDGTNKDKIEEAIQVHVDCIMNLDFRCSNDQGVLMIYNIILG